MTTTDSKTLPSGQLTLKDRLSRLTFVDACKLLGPEGAKLIQKGGNLWDIKVHDDVHVGEDLFRLRLPADNAGDEPVIVVATAVNVHFAASTPNFLILEYHPDDEPPRSDLIKQPLRVQKGYLPLPTQPGLGVELNEKAFKKYPPKSWHRTFEYREDGSVAFI